MKAENSLRSKEISRDKMELIFEILSYRLESLSMMREKGKLYSNNTSERFISFDYEKNPENLFDSIRNNLIDIEDINLKYEDTYLKLYAEILIELITDIDDYRVKRFPLDIENLAFPKKNKQQKVISIEKKTSIQGVMNNIGGEGSKVPVKITDIDGNNINATSSRDLAAELAKYLFKKIRFSGNGYWEKFENEGWQLKKLKIESYEVLNDISIRDTLKCLNDIGGNQWKELDDPHLELLKIRDDF